jgi:TonB family protein
MLRHGNIEGSVTLQFVIDRAGQVERESIVVMRSSKQAFEHPARDIVPRCRFRPGRVGTDSVRVLVEMDVTFSLRR